MWETPFDPSMLDGSGIIIHCPDRLLVKELMGILAEHGVKWCTGESPATSSSRWDVEKQNTVYYIEARKSMTYGNKTFAEDKSYTKCTFFGLDTPDFDTATDDELRSLLGV